MHAEVDLDSYGQRGLSHYPWRRPIQSGRRLQTVFPRVGSAGATRQGRRGSIHVSPFFPSLNSVLLIP